MPVAVSVQRAKKIIELVTLNAGVSLWIWGPAGVGKSSLVKQVAQDNDMLCVDFRLSQIEASDLRGLPDRQDGQTVFLPPKTLPDHQMDQAGILFLDELNRAQGDVMQAAFELVLDRKIGDYQLPENWQVVVAGNFGDDYDVRQPDPALMSRFCHIALATGSDYREEWIAYMNTQAELGVLNRHVVRMMTQFVRTGPQNNKSNVLVPGDHDMGALATLVRACPRTWDMLARIQSCMSKVEIEKFLYDIASGLIGSALAGPYSTAVQRQKNLLIPEVVLNTPVKELLGDLEDASRDEVSALWRGLIDILKTQVPKNLAQEDMVVDFVNFMVDDPFGNAGVDEATAFIKDLVPDLSKDLDENHPMLVWSRVLSADNTLYAKMCRVMGKEEWLEESETVALAS